MKRRADQPSLRGRRWRLTLAMCALLGLAAVATPRALPWALALWRPDVLFRLPGGDRVLYLTIDDAPSPASAQIVDVLVKHHVPATFFIIGSHVKDQQQLETITASGFQLGHHMESTQACSTLGNSQFRRDFDSTRHLISGVGPCEYFRPPSDLGTSEQTKYASTNGCQPVLGTVFPLDHWIHRPAILRVLVRWLAVPGGIVIMHDGAKRGPITAEVLDTVLPELERAGYEFRMLPRRPNPTLRSTPAAVAVPVASSAEGDAIADKRDHRSAGDRTGGRRGDP